MKLTIEVTEEELMQAAENLVYTQSLDKDTEADYEAIAEGRRQVEEMRRQTSAQIAESQRQINALYQLSGELVRDRATMLQILQGLNDDRIRTSENIASLAENVARIANALEQRGE